MYLIRRILYYLESLFTLLRGVRNWQELLWLRRSGDPSILLLRDGAKYAVRGPMDVWIVKETNLDRDYERYGTAIQDGWNVVDVGAGLGDFAIHAARRTPQGCVHAYEPAPDSLALLEKNLTLNRITNVKVFPNAVSASAGALRLDVSGGVAVQYSTVGGASAEVSKITVQSVLLADVVARLPGGVCDFLKMDCEGAEYETLLNLDEATLRRIKRICLEYHLAVTPYSQDDLVRFFQARGWQVRVTPSRVRRELGFLYAAPDNL